MNYQIKVIKFESNFPVIVCDNLLEGIEVSLPFDYDWLNKNGSLVVSSKDLEEDVMTVNFSGLLISLSDFDDICEECEHEGPWGLVKATGLLEDCLDHFDYDLVSLLGVLELLDCKIEDCYLMFLADEEEEE